jgi:TnpA family transposase
MKQHWTKLELVDYWTLSLREREYIDKKNNKFKLAVAIKIRYFDQYGYFPNAGSDIPLIILEYVANQLGVEINEIDQYNWQTRSSQIHNQEIRAYYGFSKFKDSDLVLIEKLVEDKFTKESLSVNIVIGEVYKLLKNKKIEPPSIQETYKYVNNIYLKCEQHFFDKSFDAIKIHKEDNLLKLGQLLNIGEDNQTILNNIRATVGKVSTSTIVKELEKLSYIESTGILNNLHYEGIPRKLLKKYHDKVLVLAPSFLVRMKESNESKFYTLLACFCKYRGAKIIDNLVDIFTRKFHKIQNLAKERVKEELWQYYTDTNKDNLFYQMVDISLKNPDGIIKDKIYSGVGGKEKLEQNKQAQKSSRRLARELEYKNLSSLYNHHYRKYFLLILRHFSLYNHVDSKVKEVVKLILDNAGDKEFQGEYYPSSHAIIVTELLSKANLEIIQNTDGKFNRLYYELVILDLLVDNLRCKNIWVKGSYKYSDPNKNLPQDFKRNPSFYYDMLSLTSDKDVVIQNIKSKMVSSIRAFNLSITKDEEVTIGVKKGKPHIFLTPYKAQDEPVNIRDLKQEVASLWPNISLLDILKETDLRIGLTTELIDMVDKTSIPHDLLRQRLLLCIFAIATNTEFKKVCIGVDGSDAADLSYVRKRFLTPEAMRYMIAKLVNNILSIRNKDVWGELNCSFASDSTKFASLEQNLMSEYHIRYQGTGILAYWHVDRKALCISSQIIRCSTSEIAAMLAGIINHASNAKVKNHSTDTHGQSLIAFAFAYLLGINLRPRIKGLGRIKLNKVDANMSKADYINLQEVMDRPISWPLIGDSYDEMVKHAAALFVGTAEVEVILKRFIIENSKNPLYQALLELGRAIRATYLCDYLSSKDLRIEVEEVLNVIENWNSGNNFIFFGKRGIISSNDDIDQELSILGLHLLQSSLTYINTLMMQQILKTDEWLNRLTATDKRAINPLFYNHINQYGIYKLDMNARLTIEED